MHLDFVDDDIDNHAFLDAEVYKAYGSDCTQDLASPQWPLLSCIAEFTDKIDPKYQVNRHARAIVEKYSMNGGDENVNLTKLLQWCWRKGTFAKIRLLKILRLPKDAWAHTNRCETLEELDAAYNNPYVGNAATDFVEFLYQTDCNIRYNNLPIYAKTISVLQSSGTGKSRMLTEVGKQIFTLPICLRGPRSPGYPLSDKNVYEYFMQVPDGNDLSYTAHSEIACFLAAAHQTMLRWLREAQKQEMLDGKGLHSWWYRIMEQREGQGQRHQFFSEVLEQANAMKLTIRIIDKSPRLDDPDFEHETVIKTQSKFYQKAQEAVQELMAFLADFHPGQHPLCVTYFDEAHELGMRFWILQRLLNNQNPETMMWYVFMGTKSSISYYNPPPRLMNSLRLQKEIQQLLRPYIALDFDQNVYPNRQGVTVTIGHLQAVEHLASYGRPLWKALLPTLPPVDMVRLASSKLTNVEVFNDQSSDHVFAVVSQRLCIEPVVVGSEAIQLADRSVAHHMRLITGISRDPQAFYTYSPSEPILVLAAANIIYNTPEDSGRLGRVLDTLSEQLCSAGVVEKGLTGELGARVLLLLARDFAAPVDRQREGQHNRNLLKPVRLLDMLGVLFGNKMWAGADQMEYDETFRNAYVNFTHWIVTKDPHPALPDQDLLANLWARGAILQCCFNQESIDLLMVVYHGDIQANAVFDPALLSAAFGQVKFKSKGDTAAEQAIRPIGLPRNLSRPLPYLTLLLELGNESTYGTTHSKIKVTTPKPLVAGGFQELTENWVAATKNLEEYKLKKGPRKSRKSRKDPMLVAKKSDVKRTRLEMDAYNRYSIAIRGASAEVYGVLRTAKVVKAFATLLSTTMPSPTSQDEAIQHMRPLERLGSKSGHTAWMSKYVVEEDGDSMDVKRVSSDIYPLMF